jgi:hypothetical protein
MYVGYLYNDISWNTGLAKDYFLLLAKFYFSSPIKTTTCRTKENLCSCKKILEKPIWSGLSQFPGGRLFGYNVLLAF